jgi:hypothetical protein
MAHRALIIVGRGGRDRPSVPGHGAAVAFRVGLYTGAGLLLLFSQGTSRVRRLEYSIRVALVVATIL